MKDKFSQSYFNLQKIAKKNKKNKKKMDGPDPCWEGYQMIGTKKGKGGKEVPNCVPKQAKSASQSFNEWANQELGEEHHKDSLRDGVMTFEEWMRDEMSEPEHARMGQGFSFDDWAREEIEEEESHAHEEHAHEEHAHEEHADECDACNRGDSLKNSHADDVCDECDEDTEETENSMYDDWQEYCQECEYEKHDDEPWHGGCKKCDDDAMMSDWGIMDIDPKMIIMSKEAKKAPAWQRSEGKSKAGGLNEKGRQSYNRATGGNLQAPVTEKNPTGKRKKRRKSFCARSKGQMKMHNIDCSKTPDKRICKARRRWKC